ncbi:MAG: SRPBCC family protein [Chloroflexota bacterium]
MSRITEELEIDVPVRVAYDQWTQFESFPEFMDAVDKVVQVDDTTLEWTASIAGVEKQWRAKIVEQRPDQVVAWKSVDGARNDGSVRFKPLSADRTRLALTLDVEGDGPVEAAGVALGVVDRQVKSDLERFREFIEARGLETGGWRGAVHAGVTSPDVQS